MITKIINNQVHGISDLPILLEDRETFSLVAHLSFNSLRSLKQLYISYLIKLS